MKDYEFDIKITQTVKASSLNNALEIVNNKLSNIPYNIDSVTFKMENKEVV
jgi:hypothetical protein